MPKDSLNGLVISLWIVMPDLIRHPEPIEFTGFRLPDQVRHKLRRNDKKTKKVTFYETINLRNSAVRDSMFDIQNGIFKKDELAATTINYSSQSLREL
jgi:hypothetical protein